MPACGGRADVVAQAVRAEARRRRPHLLIGCVVVGLAPAGAAAIGVAAGLAAGTARWSFGRRAAAVAAALVIGAAFIGSLRLAALDRPAAAAPPGTGIDAVATLLERPRAGLFGSSAPMRIDTGPARGLRIVARRDTTAWPAADPGIRFRLRGFVRPESATAGRSTVTASEANAGKPGTPGFGPLPLVADPGADFDYTSFLRSRGIGREVRVESLTVVGRRHGMAGAVDAVRRRAERGITTDLPADLAALARGMVLGDDADVREDVRDAVLLPLVALYVALAGSGASITRAGIMAAAGLFAIVVSRRSSAVYSLLLAAAVTLTLNPRTSGDPGWQLSFAAVAGMLALGPLTQPSLRRLPRPLAEAVGATLTATLATAPLLAHEFGAISLAALPANLIAFAAVA